MHTPTFKQQAIIDRACSTGDSLLLNALAGAAKTSTLEMICHALPVQPILSLAFNKRIAEELHKRLPGHVECRTLNSIGHRAWMKTCSAKVTLDTDKTYKIVKGIIEALPRGDRMEAFGLMGDLRKAVSKAKLAGYVPEGAPSHAKRLTTEWRDETDDEDLNGFEWVVEDALRETFDRPTPVTLTLTIKYTCPLCSEVHSQSFRLLWPMKFKTSPHLIMKCSKNYMQVGSLQLAIRGSQSMLSVEPSKTAWPACEILSI